jgi:hypothetical protein
MHHFGEAKKDHEGDDGIHPTTKAFDAVLTGDHGAVSIRDIDDEHDSVNLKNKTFQSVRREMIKAWVFIKMALVVHAEIFKVNCREEDFIFPRCRVLRV